MPDEPSTSPLKLALPRRSGLRVFCFYSLALLMTGGMAMLFADLLWRTGWSPSRTILLGLFILLFFFSVVGFLNGLFGFVLRRMKRNQNSGSAGGRIQNANTAIVVPIYNEDVVRVFEGLRATYSSLEKTGQIGRFDFFVLSDTTSPAKWVEEEKLWYKVVHELGALGRIYYRRRVKNEAKKSGNIRDFLRAWGRRYRYFLILDADSVMRGETLVNLVQQMEANPGVGLIQTVPGLMNAESLFGRMQQFANRFYAPIFITGMEFWCRGCGNYWGHNAIIRTEPFMRFCDLPQLPGRKPFGGHILSHDFVEAALLLKADWQVWLAPTLEGSYEEAPQGMIENAQRDRRWCQGNLQHGLLLFARGLRGISRWHLIQGIFGYLAGPLWFAFLITFLWMWVARKSTGLSQITVHSWTRLVNLTGGQEALAIFLICMGVLLISRVLALIDLALDEKRKIGYGGLARTTMSTALETLFSTLHAPLQMLWQIQFVTTILLGINSGWEAQNRTADGTTWTFALKHHWGHTVIGIIWGAVVWRLAPTTFWWFAPVLAGMILAIPLSVFTSRSTWGRSARNLGLFLTPEETSHPAELGSLRWRLAAVGKEDAVAEYESSVNNRPFSINGHPLSPPSEGAEREKHSLTDVILDPYANAIHVSLLRENALNPDYAAALASLGAGTPAVRALAEKLLAQGLDILQPPERLLLLSDADVMSWLHRQVWMRSRDAVAPTWRTALRRYAN